MVIISQNTFSRMDRMEQDNSKLKSMLAEDKADDIMVFIADEINCTRPIRIGKPELIQMARNHNLDQATRRSFIAADLVFHAQDQNGATVYFAVEISRAVNDWDLKRARRSAELLAQFTNCPAFAAAYGDCHEWDLDWTEVQWFPREPLSHPTR